MHLRSKSTQPLVIGARHARTIAKKGINIQRQPVVFRWNGEIGVVTGHAVGTVLLAGAVSAGAGASERVVVAVRIRMGPGVADGRNDADVAVVRVIVHAWKTC